MPGAEQADGSFRFWSVYPDDFDVCEVSEKEEVFRRVGEVHVWQERLREA